MKQIVAIGMLAAMLSPESSGATDPCSAYDGTKQPFDFSYNLPSGSAGYCTDMGGMGPSTYFNPEQEAIDLIAASGLVQTNIDPKTGYVYSFGVTPAAAPSCTCETYPMNSAFMIGNPPMNPDQSGSFAYQECGVVSGDWVFKTCTTTGGGANSCPYIKLLRNETAGPGEVRNELFEIGGTLTGGDIFGFTIYGHSVSYRVQPGDDSTGVASRLSEMVKATTIDQWDEFKQAPVGAKGFPPMANAGLDPIDPHPIMVDLDYDHEVTAWVQATDSSCSTGNVCPSWKLIDQTVDEVNRAQILGISNVLNPGDVYRLTILGFGFSATVFSGMTPREVLMQLADQINSTKPESWLSKVHGAKVSVFPGAAVGTSASGETVIKVYMDPRYQAYPSFESSNPSCAFTPSISVSPSEFNFGQQNVGVPSRNTFTIRNLTGDTLRGCTVSHGNPDHFYIGAGADCPDLPPFAECPLDVVATRPLEGDYYDEINVSCANAIGMSTFQGIVATAVNAPASLAFAKLSYDFGTVAVGSASAPISFVVNNSSQGPANACAVTLLDTSNFTLKSAPCASIPGGGSCSIEVVANPQTTAMHSTTLSIACGGGVSASTNSSGITVNNASGTPTPSPSATIAPSAQLGFAMPGSAALGSVKVGSTSTPQTLTILNRGTANAVGCSFSFGGVHADQFTTNGTCSVVPASDCLSKCQQVCPSGDVCDYDPSGACCIDYTNPSAPMTCPVCSSGTCNVDVTGSPTTVAQMLTQLTITCSGGVKATSPASGISMDSYPAPSSPTPTATPSCATPGAYPSANGTCVCPSGYEMSATLSGVQSCRPTAPSIEFGKGGDSFSDGFPVCGKGRMPVDGSFTSADISTTSWPMSSSKVDAFNYTYRYSVNTSTDPNAPVPLYLYKGMGLNRCVCASPETPYDANTAAANSGTGNPLTSSSARFVPDLYETISQVSTSNPNADTYSPVAMSLDGMSNGYSGATYYPGHGGVGAVASECTCPNLNEKMSGLSVLQGSGMSCSSALDTTDETTRKYMMLTKYDPSVHDKDVSTTHLLDRNAATAKITSVILPTASGGYRAYRRKIWTCAPPSQLDRASKTCKVQETVHSCDDGSVSGVASPVSQNISGATQEEQFQNTVNPKLACCMNAFDKRYPGNPLKYDCVQNSDLNFSSFDELWTSADPASAGGQSNALVLTDGAGQIATGFYTLGGVRCEDYSDFAGPIREATVNQAQMSSTQYSAGGSRDADHVEFSGRVIPPPTNVDSWFGEHKGVPDRQSNPAKAMRQCPILARAAMVVTCPSNDGSGLLPEQFQDATSGTVKCLTAKTLRVHIKIEQIYAIAGLTRMKPIDSYLDARDASGISIEGLIKAKTIGICPVGSAWVEGKCVFQ